MTSLCDDVRARVSSDWLTTRCRKDRCSVDLRNAPRPYLLIDMDKTPVIQGQSKCDYIFVGGAGKARLVALELKAGKADAAEVAKQLQAGARFADGIIPASAQVIFSPVVASGGIKKGQLAQLRKPFNKVTFRGKRVFVQRIKCGALLASVLT